MAGHRAPRLKDFHRAFLVREFSRFSSPKEAADAQRTEYGIEIAPQSAQHYDPGKVVARNLSKK